MLVLDRFIPTDLPFPLLLNLFLRSTHEVLKLRPQSLHRTKLIAHLVLSASNSSQEMVDAYRNYAFQIPIQPVHILKYLFHALLVLAFSPKPRPRPSTLTTAISLTSSSRCCSKTVGDAVRSPDACDWFQAIL